MSPAKNKNKNMYGPVSTHGQLTSTKCRNHTLPQRVKTRSSKRPDYLQKTGSFSPMPTCGPDTRSSWSSSTNSHPFSASLGPAGSPFKPTVQTPVEDPLPPPPSSPAERRSGHSRSLLPPSIAATPPAALAPGISVAPGGFHCR